MAKKKHIQNSLRKYGVTVGWLAGVIGLLVACASPRSPTPFATPSRAAMPTSAATSTPTARLTPAATPTCYPRPQMTGEKIIRPTVEVPPPSQVVAGQVIMLTFSGDYLILNNAIVCDETIVRYAYSDEFPAFSWKRTIIVLLDDQVLTTSECDYTCQLEATIPGDSRAGGHTLMVETNWERITFELQVIQP